MMELFLNTNPINVYVAPYRYDAVCAHTENTDLDRYYPDATGNLHDVNADIMLMKHNIAGTCFCNYLTTGAYAKSDKENWGIVHNFGRISYKNAYYLGWNYGFDEATALAYRSFIFNRIGKYPSTLSYSNGDDSGKSILKPYFLGGRNSQETFTDNPSDAVTTFGKYKKQYFGYPQQEIDKDYLISRQSSSRWLDINRTWGYGQSVANAYVAAEISKTIINNGWYNNFIHWHNAYSGDLDTYFNLVNTLYANTFVWRCGYDEAVEYYCYRHLINRIDVRKISNNYKVVITKTAPDEFTNIILLQTPISIVVDLSKTSLKNKDVVATNCAGIRKISDNIYSFDIDYNQNDFTISEGIANYYDFTLPVILSSTYDSGIFTVITDKPTQVVFYLAARNAASDTSNILYRSNTVGTNHLIDFNNSTIRNYYKTTALSAITDGDVYIGVITNEKQSIVSSVIRIN